MDGHFVPNITLGPPIIKALRDHTDLPFDVHLMISPVDSYIDDFVDAGADIVSVHMESGPHVHRTLQAIRARGAKAGIVLNPHTPAKMLDYVMDMVDLVLVMSVNPGFGGQSFIGSQLGLDIDLEVDGGINQDTARQVIDAGANVLVAGTATFKGGPEKYAENISLLRGG